MLTDALMEDENFEEASKICLEALKINEKSLEKNSPALINTYRKLASVEYFLSNHEKMEELLIKAIECAESDSLNEDLYEKVLLSLSAYYMESKRYKNAETQLMKLLNIRKNKLSDIHPDLIENHNMLAQCFTFQKEYIKAQASLEEGFDVVAHSFGKTSSQALNQIDQMAFLSYKAKKYPQAITRCQETIEMLKKQYPDNHQNYLPFYKRLSLIFKTTKDLQKATDFSLKALKVSEFVHGTESTRIVVDLTDISDLYKLRKMPTKAILFAERGVKILEKDKNSDRQYLATALNDLAALYEVAGDKDKANSLYKRSRDIDKATP
jgi:tetratricopeptide (TPR) repeat protein